MKLYGVAGSNNVRKVQAVISHLNLDVELELMDFFTGDLKTEEYLAMNPNGKVPLLVDGDYKLWESNAINRYLCRTAGEQTLYPADPKVASDIDRWLDWELAHYNRQFGFVVWETVAKPMFMGGEPNQVIVDWSTEFLKQFAGVLNDHMNGREYAVGKEMTIADYALIHNHFFKDKIPFDWSPYPHLNAYYERIASLPHWSHSEVSPEELGRKPA